MSYFGYKQYKDAALKHLKSCQEIIKYFNCQYNCISPGTEKELLINVFYLSGYTMECIINYAIFSKIYTSTKSLSKSDNVYRIFDPTNKFSFYSKYNDNNGVTCTANYYVSGHNFMKNITLLKKLTPGGNIPLVHDPKIVPSSVSTLIRKWDVKIRYETNINPPINKTDIASLVEFTEKFYNEVIKVVR